MKNKQWVLNKRPSGVPNLEEDLKINISDVKKLDYGDLLLETQYLSLDPYMRGRMNGGPSYSKRGQAL